MNVYAYLDVDFPPTAWAIMRGSLIPLEQIPGHDKYSFVSYTTAGLIRHQKNARLFNELIIENVRDNWYPDRISRLRGLYFFDNPQTARCALEWGGHFIEENLFELSLDPKAQYTRCDANWITYMSLGQDGRLLDPSQNDWARKYWDGEPYGHGREPVWEILTNGVATVTDDNLRNRCEMTLREIFPESRNLISLARRVSKACDNLAYLITPFVRRGADGLYELCYIIRKANDEKLLPYLSKEDLEFFSSLRGKQWQIPDLREYGTKFFLDTEFCVDRKVNIFSLSVHRV